MLSPVTAQRSYGEPRAQTNASVGKFAAQNIIDVSAVVALSYAYVIRMFTKSYQSFKLVK